MAWNVKLSSAAERDLDRLDPATARRILRFLYERLAQQENPRSIGEALTGPRLGRFVEIYH